MATREFALRPGAPSEEPELSTCERHDDAQTRPIGMCNIRDETIFMEIIFMEWEWKIYLTSTTTTIYICFHTLSVIATTTLISTLPESYRKQP